MEFFVGEVFCRLFFEDEIVDFNIFYYLLERRRRKEKDIVRLGIIIIFWEWICM